MQLYVKEICTFLEKMNYSYELKGKKEGYVNGFAALNNLEDWKITWVNKWTSNNNELLNAHGNLIVVCNYLENQMNISVENNTYIQCDDPKLIFFEILRAFFTNERFNAQISVTAKVETDRIGKNCSIGEYSIIGKDVVIGDNVIIGDHVVLKGKVIIGNFCEIQSGSVIGEEGFGYYELPNGHYKRVSHLGGVEIRDYVEIGSNTCIDRGTIDNTVIGKYSKIDNLVHVAHNVQIGENVLVVAGAVLCGSCILENGVYIGPGAIIRNQVTVKEKTFVGMQACVVKDTVSGTTIAGVPAKEMK